MKVPDNWLTEFAQLSHGRPYILVRRAKTDIDVSDLWAHRTNRRGEITKVGPYLELTRVGWEANKDQIARLWHQYQNIRAGFNVALTWPQYEDQMYQGLESVESDHDKRYVKMKESMAHMEAYLKAIEPLRPPKA